MVIIIKKKETEINNGVTAAMKIKNKELKQGRSLRKLSSFKSQLSLAKSAPSFQKYE